MKIEFNDEDAELMRAILADGAAIPYDFARRIGARLEAQIQVGDVWRVDGEFRRVTIVKGEIYSFSIFGESRQLANASVHRIINAGTLFERNGELVK